MLLQPSVKASNTVGRKISEVSDFTKHVLALLPLDSQTPWIACGLPMKPVLPCLSQHIGKDSDAGRDWGQEEKGTTEDEMAGWHHWLDGRESEWTLGVGDGQRGMACCDSWDRKESGMTERLNWTEEQIRIQRLGVELMYSFESRSKQ